MRIACYARKSNDKNNDSISNQLSIIESYIAVQKEFTGADILRFSDDGFTGINLERDMFTEVLTKVRMREIDCIIVKDLSRLGRNYLEVVKLTESIFPFMGVRVIAINDGYDSKYKSDVPIDMYTAIKAVFNEFHVIETSEKLRKTFAHKVKNDAFFGNIPYGYVLSEKRQPIVDEEKAEIIKEIFSLCIKGLSTFEIARTLNTRNILTNRNKQWSGSRIRFILANEQYIGVRRALTSYRDIKTKKWIKAKESEIYINENAFPPIIDRDTFEKVQQILPKLNKSHSPEYHVMARKLYCGHCSRTLGRMSNFACYSYLTTGKPRCFDGTLKQSKLYPEVLQLIKKYISSEIEYYKIHFSFSDKNKLESKITCLKEQKAMIYERFFEKHITENEFNEQKVIINDKINELNKELDNWRKCQAFVSKSNRSERPIDTLKRLYNCTELTKEHMQFVKIINVYSKEKYDIILHEEKALTVLCRNMSIYEEL